MAAPRLGGNVTMVGRVGDDLFGQDQIKSLQEAGIETRYITVDPEAPTGVGSITLDDSSGNNRIIIVPEPTCAARQATSIGPTRLSNKLT